MDNQYSEQQIIAALVNELLALVSEALEDIRNNKGMTQIWYEKDGDGNDKPCGIPIEMADIIIRVLHFCGKHNIDIRTAVLEKMKYNDSRPYLHGKKF